MKTINTLYSRLALITSVTLVVGYFVVYAAWTTISPVNTGDVLTKSLINNIIGNLVDLNDRTSNLGFSLGNVGIGISTPNAKLDVMYTTGSHIIIGAMNGGVSGDEYLQFYWPNTNNISIQALEKDVSFDRNILLNPNGGYVGIGNASPLDKLDINGVIRIGHDGTNRGRIYVSSNCTGDAQLGVDNGRYLCFQGL